MEIIITWSNVKEHKEERVTNMLLLSTYKFCFLSSKCSSITPKKFSHISSITSAHYTWGTIRTKKHVLIFSKYNSKIKPETKNRNNNLMKEIGKWKILTKEHKRIVFIFITINFVGKGRRANNLLLTY